MIPCLAHLLVLLSIVPFPSQFDRFLFPPPEFRRTLRSGGPRSASLSSLCFLHGGQRARPAAVVCLGFWKHEAETFWKVAALRRAGPAQRHDLGPDDDPEIILHRT